MNTWKRFCAALIAALCLLIPALAVVPSAEAVAQVAQYEQADSKADSELIKQIQTTYKAAKKRARVKSFKGKCGKYVNQQLVVLGVNTKYVGANGNREYDVYSKRESTTGGYRITAFSAKKYTLKTALKAIAAADPHARNILIGFERGTSKASKKYGHTLFIHGIENGNVYFSDSYAQTVNGKRFKEGAPIVCSIDTFCGLYQTYKLDGVIWFR